MTKPKTEKAEKKDKKPRATRTKTGTAPAPVSFDDLMDLQRETQRRLDDLAFCADKLITWAVNRHPDVPEVASYIQAKSRLT